MPPPRQSASARRPASSRPAPLPKGSRVPQPMIVYWIVRTVFIGALVLYFASPTILLWAADNRVSPAHQQRGLLIGLLLDQRPNAAEQGDNHDTRAAGEDQTRDSVAPVLASAVLIVLTPAVVTALGQIGVAGSCLMLGEALLACWGM